MSGLENRKLFIWNATVSHLNLAGVIDYTHMNLFLVHFGCFECFRNIVFVQPTDNQPVRCLCNRLKMSITF